jgi:hypothetical protein
MEKSFLAGKCSSKISQMAARIKSPGILLIVFILLSAVAAIVESASERTALNISPPGPMNPGTSNQFRNQISRGELRFPVMVLTKETLIKNALQHKTEKQYQPRSGPPFPTTRTLLGHIDYVPWERNQVPLNNCWVWAGTAALEAANDIQNGIKQRLSIQYFDSNYTNGDEWAGDPGTTLNFVQFYNTTKKLIPWSNSNADYRDGTQCGSNGDDCNNNHKASVDPAIIQMVPNYRIKEITAESIQTHDVDQASAMSNIKAAILDNKPVILSITIPNDNCTQDLHNFWAYHDEDYPLDMSPWQDESITNIFQTMSGHYVLCVGYDGNDWICLNSWPIGYYITLSGNVIYINRRNTLFRLNMSSLNYDWKYIMQDGLCPGCPPLYRYLTEWEVLNVTFTAKPPIHPSLALDPDENPHIAYFDSSGSLLYASWVGKDLLPIPVTAKNGSGHWNVATVYSGSLGSRDCSLGFDQNGVPHISFVNSPNTLKYASLTNTGSGSQWTVDWVDSSLDGFGSNSLAIAADGTPNISYYDYSTRSLNFAWKDGQEWHGSVIDDAADVGGGSSLKISDQGIMGVSYTDYSSGALRYASQVPGSTWETSIVDGPTWVILGNGVYPISSHVGKYSSLALGPDGTPLIAYYSEEIEGLKIANQNGNSWESAVAFDKPKRTLGEFGSFVLVDGISPQISFYDATVGDLVLGKLAVTPYGGAKSQKTVDSYGNVGQYTSLAVSSSPPYIPYIAYYDATNGAVKSAWKAPPSGWQISAVGGKPPVVTGIKPKGGHSGTSVDITAISGDNFWTKDGIPPRVLLTKSGQHHVVATNVSVESAKKITCTFKLPSGAGSQGLWNAAVINPDGQRTALTSCFTVYH